MVPGRPAGARNKELGELRGGGNAAGRAALHGLGREIVPAIGRAFAAITLGGGAADEAEAIEVMRGIQLFEHQPTAILASVAHLLHACYPGERWIEPLQPDLLGEHLVLRQLELGADELLNLTLGPPDDPPDDLEPAP